MAKKLWGGRFDKEQDFLFWEFQSSLDYDVELVLYDICGSIAHVKMLGKCRIIPKKAEQSIVKELGGILKQAQAGAFKIDAKAEDIHTAVFITLQKKIGGIADYMHTARSRNDQVALDLRMYCREKAAGVTALLKKLQLALLDFAKNNVDVVIPGLTHTQHAMPVLLSHQILAYVNMFERDIERFSQARERSDEMPLGSCALAGTSLTIDRRFVAKLLGFSRISENSIDSVSDRDFVIDILSAASMLFMHISRFAEDIILLSTPEFGFIEIGEEFCTGSSMMPQKKNPDSLELARGASSRAYSNLMSVLVMMKGLPLSYNRDMQFDKEPLFSSIRLSEQVLRILAGLVKSLKVNRPNIEKSIEGDESLFALDMAEYLVGKGVAFSRAHGVIGKIVLRAQEKNCKISAMALDELKDFAKEFEEDVFKIFDDKRSVMSKRSIGSTNPILIRRQIEKWDKRVKTKA